MHTFTNETADMMVAVLSQWLERLRMDAGLDHPTTVEHLQKIAPSLINDKGNNPHEVLDYYHNKLAIHTISCDSPRFLSFIPAAPTKASLLFDSLVSAASLNGTTWLEAAGVVWAENQVLRFLADQVGLPKTAGGCFVSGGSIANLSALAVARDQWKKNNKDGKTPVIVVSLQSHSSVANAAHILGCDTVAIPSNEALKMTASTVLPALQEKNISLNQVCALVATAGTTNLGLVDDLDSLSTLCQEKKWWLHVDAAYGGAGLLLPEMRPLYQGVEYADSIIVDPHKWLFAPLDCAALLYRNPALAPQTHAQKAGYLEVTYDDETVCNPTDYAIHLTRRARGMPLWFSLCVHGATAYREAIRQGISMAQETAEKIKKHPVCSLLLEPELSVVAFKRDGWKYEQYKQWSDWLLEKQIGFVVPSTFQGEPILRLVFLNPATSSKMVDEILETL